MGWLQAIFARSYLPRSGPWLEELIQAATPRAGERFLEVSAEGLSVYSQLGTTDASAHFFAAQSGSARSSKRKHLYSNVVYLDCHDCRLESRAAFFDKVVCLFGLHALSPSDKLALLKEMFRVLRHGGTLHLVEFDKPQKPNEMSLLRGTSYLYGPATAQPHLDGSWFKLIEQAGFVGVRRMKNYSEMGARVALIRARRA